MEKEEGGTLYVVATPIGNLEDITLRALRVLKEVDVILCEDTRVTRRLLERYGIKKPLLSYHQHSRLGRVEEILGLLASGKNLALVSDAGTPGISDPGNELIQHILAEDGPPQGGPSSTISIISIPGPSAITALASVAGVPMQRFYFAGYPPQKKGRKTFFEKLVAVDVPIILFESPYRILKTLNDLRFALGDLRYAVIGRELTKQFETIYRETLGEISERIAKEKPRGEYVVVVAPEEKR